MAHAFDPELVESTVLSSDGHAVDVYKIGGGTLGRAYEGLWGYRLVRGGQEVASGADLRTGVPKTHDEAAQLVLDIFDPQEQ